MAALGAPHEVEANYQCLHDGTCIWQALAFREWGVVKQEFIPGAFLDICIQNMCSSGGYTGSQVGRPRKTTCQHHGLYKQISDI